MQIKPTRPMTLLAILMTLSLTLAACGSSDATADSGLSDIAADDATGNDTLPDLDGAIPDLSPRDAEDITDMVQADGKDASQDEASDLPPDAATDVSMDVAPDVQPPPCIGTPGTAVWPTDVSTAFIRGPFVQDVRDSHAFIVFRPTQPLPQQGCATWTIEGVSSAVPIVACVDPDPFGQYTVRLDALPQDTEITYSVFVGQTLTAGPFAFRSAPSLQQPQRILMMSDLHANPERTQTILSKIVSQGLAAGVDFAMTVGDHIDQAEEGQYDDLFDGLRPLLHRIPLFATIGNHDSRSDSYFEAFVLPEADPPDPAAPELYYSFRRGNTWIGVLEIIDWQLSWTFGEPLGQAVWLEKELDSPAARSARWRLLFIHQPPWAKNWAPCDPDHPMYGEESLRDMLVPLAAKMGVSALFSGHFHDYEHGTMDGVELFVLGGAGGGLEVSCPAPEGLPQPWTEKIVHHSLTVDTGCDALTVVATDIEGTEIDRVSIPYAGK